jgi:hypothetical protein
MTAEDIPRIGYDLHFLLSSNLIHHCNQKHWTVMKWASYVLICHHSSSIIGASVTWISPSTCRSVLLPVPACWTRYCGTWKGGRAAGSLKDDWRSVLGVGHLSARELLERGPSSSSIGPRWQVPPECTAAVQAYCTSPALEVPTCLPTTTREISSRERGDYGREMTR